MWIFADQQLLLSKIAVRAHKFQKFFPYLIQNSFELQSTLSINLSVIERSHYLLHANIC